MSTNPLGKGTRNVSVNMTEKLRDTLSQLAADSGMTLSAYIKAILADAAESGVQVSTRIEKNPKQGKGR